MSIGITCTFTVEPLYNTYTPRNSRSASVPIEEDFLISVALHYLHVIIKQRGSTLSPIIHHKRKGNTRYPGRATQHSHVHSITRGGYIDLCKHAHVRMYMYIKFSMLLLFMTTNTESVALTNPIFSIWSVF